MLILVNYRYQKWQRAKLANNTLPYCIKFLRELIFAILLKSAKISFREIFQIFVLGS